MSTWPCAEARTKRGASHALLGFLSLSALCLAACWTAVAVQRIFQRCLGAFLSQACAVLGILCLAQMLDSAVSMENERRSGRRLLKAWVKRKRAMSRAEEAPVKRRRR
mmetsp:Transcript_22519/g.53644  ORF Transcript_22519/g.53644 Transcript_22519/m.53644 type:complete len:108 (-) Transcript_22519:28-351(-)